MASQCRRSGDRGGRVRGCANEKAIYPWLPSWPAFTKLPLSGNVSQAISPLANWFSPSIEFDIAGDRQIAADVVTNVASYGKQLGVLTDAILAVAHGNASPAIKRLNELAQQTEACKRAHRRSLEESARQSLDALKKTDREAFHRVLASYKT